MNSHPAPDDLRTSLERFTVSYEVRPESAVLRGHTIGQVGYVVDLYGDDGDDRPLQPCDERCREIFSALYRIALWAVPDGDRGCHINIDGADPSLHCLRSGKGRGCAQLEIHILHVGAPDRPLDADQKSALGELVGRLETLGVRSGGSAR